MTKRQDETRRLIRAGIGRDDAIRAACPNCGADPGAACRRANGASRVQVHMERMRAAEGLRK